MGSEALTQRITKVNCKPRCATTQWAGFGGRCLSMIGSSLCLLGKKWSFCISLWPHVLRLQTLLSDGWLSLTTLRKNDLGFVSDQRIKVNLRYFDKIIFFFFSKDCGLQVIDIPILFLHAEDDWVVPYRWYNHISIHYIYHMIYHHYIHISHRWYNHNIIII